MSENINNANDQRQCSSSGGNGLNNLSRKKANNGGDLTASPKYNKSNLRGFNRDNQQQKQNRGNNNYHREQRNAPSGNNETTNSKPRHREHHNLSRDVKTNSFNCTGVDDENLDDTSSDLFDIDDQVLTPRGQGINSAKKANMSHLLNFHYLDKQRVNVRGNRRSFNYHSNGRWSSSGHSNYRQSFSKEQFLQANCQFVVEKGSADYSIHFADPDLAIDWSQVEEVHLHSMQPLKCPICLSEPQAGKITRCGHVYCWSCLLHYLALSDKDWRKCPVCAESIYKKDIRSVRGIVSRCLKPGDWIHFRLMCRERGSVLYYPRKNNQNDANEQKYAHLLFADDETIRNEIIHKEKLELLKQLEDDGDQPEVCFIKQALEENELRDKIIRERMPKRKSVDEFKVTPNEPVELLPAKLAVVYDNAFDNIIEPLQEEQPNVVGSEETLENNIPISTGPQNLTYFYQADDVYHAYLNGLNTRILLHEYGSYQNCPDELHVRIEAIESHFMTEELRPQFRSLSHLPLTCEFQVIEVRLHPPMISPATVQIFADEIHRRRHLRSRKERLETRRQQQAELVETQKLFSQYPPEMMFIPQKSFPVNSTDSMEEFPAMISTATSSSPPSASAPLSDENLSPPTGVSFAQMLKQQPPPVTRSKPTINQSLSIDISSQTKKKKKNKNDDDTDDDPLNENEEYYVSVPKFHSSFSLEEVFDRLKLVNGEENPQTSINQATSKKKNKKTKQVLFATGMGGQAKL